MAHSHSYEQLDLVAPTDQLLNHPSDRVEPREIRTEFIQGVIDRMLQLAAGKGRGAEDSRQMVGLAAAQIGVNKRIVTIDTTADGTLKEQNLVAIINPNITQRSAERVLGREACWSCGNICGAVWRAQEVTLVGQGRDGHTLKLELGGFTARIAQHETDHLMGVRFPDRIPLDEPKHLHLVDPADFGKYRQDWEQWPTVCPREQWEMMKNGIAA